MTVEKPSWLIVLTFVTVTLILFHHPTSTFSATVLWFKGDDLRKLHTTTACHRVYLFPFGKALAFGVLIGQCSDRLKNDGKGAITLLPHCSCLRYC